MHMQNWSICVSHGSALTQIKWNGKWVHLTQFYRLGHICAKNYQNWWKFDIVMTKTILTVFLKHSVLLNYYRQTCWSMVVIKGSLTCLRTYIAIMTTLSRCADLNSPSAWCPTAQRQHKSTVPAKNGYCIQYTMQYKYLQIWAKKLINNLPA